ncbi:S41 family peptidase [Aquimarina sp. Aq107]|uniref:S41 family peptidase n=1 Tax=Aquimarina sp. Aq107 TaxID=1191912 RepID=UPI000D557EA4|nr:S41 family peptidase [Aquimarina sp. Aq107]
MKPNTKKEKTFLFILLLILCSSLTSNGQEQIPIPVSKKETKAVVNSISKLVNKYYVSLEVGKQMSDLIISNNKSGVYKNITDPNKLAAQLTNDLRSINGDLHMNVSLHSPSGTVKENKVSKNIDTKGTWSNYGFQEIKVLDGNIGYLKISHFTNWNSFEEAKKVINSSFLFLQNTDALILDVRNNRGGFEEIVAYLISYLFDEGPIHLSDYYRRYENKRVGIYTSKDIPGKKLPNIPVYVLVNDQSASAAESLAYMLKHLKRATIIGETTMGAGNGAMTHKINERFSVSISSETTINAVTQTSFEQVGVIPNIKTSSEEAFNKSYFLALNYLKENNSKNIDPSNYETVIAFLPSNQGKEIVDINSFKEYIGTYKNANVEIVVTANDSNLFAEVIGKGGKLKLIAKGNHTFLVDNLKERIQFVMNEENEIIKLIGIDSPMELEKTK